MLKQIRCAIYTRKSREEGLEQEFNSLDAQRVAGESYIQSQQFQGWEVIGKKYDDGGYSGGNTKRPALKELFKDIESGLIDCVVVYKTDRLSRSLVDFIKMIEFFQKHNVAFVSVTESFNTEATVGRLMLNILLSFGQYEREVTSDRVKDKIAASRAKGMWTGGTVPLGYDLKDKKLIINEEEAKLIKYIFERFIEVPSAMAIAKELNKKEYRTKNGKAWFSDNKVRAIINNVVYIGKIKHKENCYDGEHEAIIDEKLWSKVKAMIKTREVVKVKREPAVLKGLIRCDGCNSSMTPTYTKKKNKHYRYYVCDTHLKGKTCQGKDQTISAGEIEQVVLKQIYLLMGNEALIEQTFKKGQEIALTTLKELSKMWDSVFRIEQEKIIHLLIKTIWLKEKGITIEISKKGLESVVNQYKQTHASVEAESGEVTISVDMQLSRSRGKSTVIILPTIADKKERKNSNLIYALGKARLWQEQLEKGEYSSFTELCTGNKIKCRKYASRILCLNILSPKIKAAILQGTQPPQLRLSDFINKKIDLSWEKQWEQFHFNK